MKLLLAFFIAFTTPVLLFMATLLYGNTSNDHLKASLNKSGVYTELSKHLTREDPTINDPFLPVVQDRFTPEYLRDKTESILDATTLWVTGKSQVPPIISFHEFKNDLSQYTPELLKALENIPDESELEEAGVDQKQRQAYLQQAKQIRDFTKQDFTVSLDQHLQAIKTVYHGLQIAMPIIAIILLCCLFMIWKLAEDLPAKFKWLGITFLLTSIIGYIIILSSGMITALVTQTNFIQGSEFTTLITPIFLAVLNYFVQLYATYQQPVSIVFLVLAVLCFVMMIVTRNQAEKPLKPLNTKRSYWNNPSQKK